MSMTTFTPLQQPKKIKNIIFDFSGVLLTCPYQTFIKTTFPNLDEQKIKMLSDLIFESKLWSHYDLGLDYAILRTQLCELINATPDLIQCDATDIDRLIKNIQLHMLPMEDTVALMHELKAAGFTLYGLTNMPKELYDYFLTQYDFLSLMSGIIASSTTHLAKPDKKIYQRLLNDFQLPAKACLFLDDRAINLPEAEKLGMRTILFTDAETIRKTLNEDYNIHLMKEPVKLRAC